MNVETNPPARLPHHDALPAHAAVLREQLHPAAESTEGSLWRLRRRAPVLR